MTRSALPLWGPRPVPAVLHRVASGVRQEAPSSATALVLRELTWLVLLVQATWMIASPDLWPWHLLPVPGAVLVTLTVVTWVALLLTQFRGGPDVRRLARHADVLAVVVAGAAVGLWSVAGSADSAAESASLALLTAIVMGGLWDVRASVIGIVLLAVLSLEPLLRATPGFADGEAVADVGLTAYILVAGLGVAGVRVVLLRNAARVEASTRERDELERARLLVEGVQAALRREERHLHETVLNTLTAISRGGLERSERMARLMEERCREAIEVLTSLQSDRRADPIGDRSAGRGLGEDFDVLVAGLRVEGLDVDVVVDPLDDVPPEVTAAVGTAVREALLNVARHAQARHARVLVRVRRSPALALRAEVRDDGQGFDKQRTARRFGLDQAIADPMVEVGGSATLDTQQGVGTKVILEWRGGRVADAIDRQRATAAGVAPSTSATTGIYLAGTAALAWLQFDHPPITLSDVAFVAVLGLLLALATPEAPLSWGLILTVSALGPMFALLQGSAGGSGAHALGGGWALSAIASLFMVAAALGPRWGWLPLVVSWVVIDGDVAAQVIQPATVAILAGAMLGRGLRRDARAMERAHRDRLAAESALEITQAGLETLHARYAALGESEAVALLEGIVEGRLDPDDQQVRDRASLEETFIRNVMRVDPDVDELRALVARLSVLAYRRGVHLRTDLALPDPANLVLDSGVGGSLTRAVECSAPQGAARLTVRTEGASIVLRLITPIVEGEREAMKDLTVPGQLADPTDPGDHTMMWEVRLAGVGTP